jgi:hypothetical protein
MMKGPFMSESQSQPLTAREIELFAEAAAAQAVVQQLIAELFSLRVLDQAAINRIFDRVELNMVANVVPGLGLNGDALYSAALQQAIKGMRPDFGNNKPGGVS